MAKPREREKAPRAKNPEKSKKPEKEQRAKKPEKSKKAESPEKAEKGARRGKAAPADKGQETKQLYKPKLFADKLAKLASALSEGKGCMVQVGKTRLTVPPDAKLEIEIEEKKGRFELEFELSWPAK